MLPIQFCQFASQLAQDSSLGPAEYRTAVSRAYYGTFHAAYEFLCRVNIEPPQNHGAVWNALLSCKDTALVKAGSDLHVLYSDRYAADYELTDSWIEIQASAQRGVGRAFAILAVLTTCLSDLVRKTQVENDLGAWVKKLPLGSGYKILP